MTSSFARNAIVLGLLSAIGPFAIDMYLPALPAIAADLHASTVATQMTLMIFFVSFGVCQIFYGPVSDMIGRKPPLYFGIVVFALGGIGCGLSPSIEWLIFFRFVQGLGAASVMVIPRAIIRDLHTGADATRLMSLIMLVFSVSPILAPLAGSALIVPFGWRAVFAAVTIAAIFSFLLVAFVLKETRPPEERVEVSVRSVLDGFGVLLRDWRFLGLTFIGGFGMASFFCVSRQFVIHLYRSLRVDADAIQPRILGQRHRLYRRVAVQRLSRRALRSCARRVGRGCLLHGNVGLDVYGHCVRRR